MSREFENDPSGSSVLARYNELKQLLAEKYGAGKSVERVEQAWEGNYFMLGINAGRSQWFTDYKTKDLEIQLGIGGDGSSGYWRLIVEQRALEDEFEQGKKPTRRAHFDPASMCPPRGLKEKPSRARPPKLHQAAWRQAVLMQSTWRWSVPQQPPSTLI